MTKNKCQQEFEKFFIDKYPYKRVRGLAIKSNGNYAMHETNSMYQAWCAAWEAATKHKEENKS
jgi:hypothetical protein